MRLYIVRHGETDWNRARRVQGHADIPLNAFGRRLAEETAEGMADIPVDIAYTSPLIRARETAEIILRGREVPLILCEEIKELGFGKYEGLCCGGEMKEKESDTFNKFFTDTANYKPAEGGESIQELYARTGKFLKELCDSTQLSGKSILLSTHGAAMTAILNRIRGEMEIADFWKRQVPYNCAVTTVEVKDGVPEIIEENHVYYKEPVNKWNIGE